MKDKVLSHSLSYGAATIISRGTLLVALLVFPALLQPADYGALAMVLAIAALVNLIVPVEVTQGLARYYPESAPGDKKLYASAAWWFSLAMLGAFLTLGQLFADPLCRLILGSADYILPFRVGLLLMAGNTIFYTIQSQFRWEFRPSDYVVVSCVYSLLTLALSVLLAWLASPPLLGILAGQFIGAAIAIIVGMDRLRNSFMPRLDWPKLGAMLRFSLPLVPASLALFLSVYASRLILNGMSSLADVGVYTFASQIAAIATLTVLGVQAALTPLIMAHYLEPETPSTVARLFEGFVATAWPLCLALGLFAPEAIALLGLDGYSWAGPLVMILAPALLMMQMYIFFPGFAIAKKTVWQMWVSIVGAIICVAANFLLIRFWGVAGAAAATLLAATVFLALWLSLSQRLYPVPVRWLRVAACSAVAASAGAAGISLDYPNLAVALIVKSALTLIVFGWAVATGLLPLARGIQAGKTFLTGLRR